MSGKPGRGRGRERRRSGGVGASVKLVAAAVVAFILGLLLGAASAPSPGGATTVTMLSTVTEVEAVTTTVTTRLTETVTRTVTATPERPKAVYSLRVLEVVVDRVSEATHDHYILEVEASYKGDRSWPLSPSLLELVSDRGYKYSNSFSFAVRQWLPSVDLRDGESARGQVVFKLPKGERPAKLVYVDKLNDISLEVAAIPAPSREVSQVFLVEEEVRSEHRFILASGSILTPGGYFYSGEEVEVELTIKYSKGIGEPASITITSISVEAFELVRVEPEPPIEVRDGEEVTIRLVLKAPAVGYSGNLEVTIHA